MADYYYFFLYPNLYPVNKCLVFQKNTKFPEVKKNIYNYMLFVYIIICCKINKMIKMALRTDSNKNTS